MTNSLGVARFPNFCYLTLLFSLCSNQKSCFISPFLYSGFFSVCCFQCSVCAIETDDILNTKYKLKANKWLQTACL